MVEGQQVGWHEGSTRFEPPIKITVRGNGVIIPPYMPLHVALAAAKWSNQDTEELEIEKLTFEQITWLLQNIVISPPVTEEFLKHSNTIVAVEILKEIMAKIAPTKEEMQNLLDSPTS